MQKWPQWLKLVFWFRWWKFEHVFHVKNNNNNHNTSMHDIRQIIKFGICNCVTKTKWLFKNWFFFCCRFCSFLNYFHSFFLLFLKLCVSCLYCCVFFLNFHDKLILQLKLKIFVQLWLNIVDQIQELLNQYWPICWYWFVHVFYLNSSVRIDFGSNTFFGAHVLKSKTKSFPWKFARFGWIPSIQNCSWTIQNCSWT